MPGVLIAFYALLGFGLGSTLIDKPHLWSKKDVHGEKARGFRSWISSSPNTLSHNGKCSVQIFGISLGQQMVRYQIDNMEKNVDWSWSTEKTAKDYQRRNVYARYLDPNGKELACHELTFVCFPENWDGSIRETISDGIPCQDAAPVRDKDSGKPKLVLKAPNQVSSGIHKQGLDYMSGLVTIHASIEGNITEEWYCPRIIWEIPIVPGLNPNQVMTSTEESDCPPFNKENSKQADRRWSKTVLLPEGDWTITVKLMHSDHVIASENVRIIVGSTDPSRSPYGNWWY